MVHQPAIYQFQIPIQLLLLIFTLVRLDYLYLDKLGNFIHVPGIAGEDPRYPALENINMLVARFSIAPFTFKTRN